MDGWKQGAVWRWSRADGWVSLIHVDETIVTATWSRVGTLVVRSESSAGVRRVLAPVAEEWLTHLVWDWRKLALGVLLLLLHPLALGGAADPALAPLHDQVLEDDRINTHAWAEADQEVTKAHHVNLAVLNNKGKMAGKRKEGVIVVRWKVGQLLDQDFWNRLHWGWSRWWSGVVIVLSCGEILVSLDPGDNAVGSLLWEEWVRELTKPRLQEGADGVDIVEVLLGEKINVILFVEGQ